MKVLKNLPRRILCLVLSCLLVGTQSYYTCADPIPPGPLEIPSDVLHSSLPEQVALTPALVVPDTLVAAVCIGIQSYTWPNIVIEDPQADALLHTVYTTGCAARRIYQKPSPSSTRIAYSSAYCNALLAYARYAHSQAEYRESCQGFLRMLDHIHMIATTYNIQLDESYTIAADTGAKCAGNAWAAVLAGQEPKPAGDPASPTENVEATGKPGCNGTQTGNAQKPEATAATLGCPDYSINPDNLSVFLTDTPLAYQPVKGPPVIIRLVYSTTRDTKLAGCLGKKWHCSLDSWLTITAKDKWPQHTWNSSDPIANVVPALIQRLRIVTSEGRLDDYNYSGFVALDPPEDNAFRISFISADADGRDARLRERASVVSLDVYATPSGGNLVWSLDNAVAHMPDNWRYSFAPQSANSRTNLVSITDNNGNTLSYNRDSYGCVTSIMDACGGQTTCAYTKGPNQPDNVLYAVTDPAQRTAHFEMNANNYLYAVTDAAGFRTQFAYCGNDFTRVYSYHVTDPSDAIVHRKYFIYFNDFQQSQGVYNRLVIRDIENGSDPGTYEICQWNAGVYYTQNKNMYAHKYYHYNDLDCDYWALKDNGSPEYLVDDDYHLAAKTVTMADSAGITRLRTVMATPDANSPDAGTTVSVHDHRGNLTEFADASSRTSRFTYDASNNLIFAVAPDNATNTYFYDTCGNLVRSIAPDGRWTRAYAYNAAGQLTNVLALVRTDRVPMTIGPLEQQTLTNPVYETAAPEAAPVPAVFSVPESVEEVDALIASLPSEPTSALTAPAAASAPLVPVGFEIVTAAVPPQEPDPDHWVDLDVCNTLLAVEYAPDNSSAILTYPSGEQIRYTFDVVGQVTAVESKPKGAANFTLQYSMAYDGLDRVTAVTYPGGTSVSIPMNLKGPASITDRDGNISAFAYNESFQPTSVTRPDGNTVGFSYAGLRLRTLTNARGYQSGFDYDGGRLTALQYPGCEPQRFGYDWPGNLTSVTNEDNLVTLYTHDPAGRVTSTSLSSSQSSTPPSLHSSFSYNPAGRLASLADNTGAHTYSYDLRGRLTNDCFAAAGNNALSYTLAYAYDNLDQRTNMLVMPAPVNGAAIPAHSITYEYDYATMTLTSITDTTMTPGQKTVQYTYDANGRLQTTSYANGAGQTYAYNGDQRLARLTTRGAANYLINDQIYEYTPGGMLTEISAYQNSSTYTYDDLNQVETESTFLGAGGPQGNNLYAECIYAYDANGNRTAEERTDVLPNLAGTTAVMRGYAATADDRIDSYNQYFTSSLEYYVIYTHDARGNRLTRTSNVQGQRSFGYDHFSRMTGATNDTTSVVYTYDALGRKVKRTKGSPSDPYNMQTTRYIYDGLDCIFMLHEDYGGVCPEWVLRGLGVAPGIGNVVATQLGTTAPRYYHPNHRGDTVFITNQQGVQDANLVYDAFGRLIAQSGNVDHMEGISASYMTAVKFRFSSKEWDADAQLYYFGFRWYDPDTGTWTTKDPLNFSGGDMNTYRFAANRATIFVDCYGLSFWSTVGSVAGKVWNAPNTLMGATLGAIGTAFGGDMPSFSNNGIEFTNNPVVLENTAITLGNAINYSSGFPPWEQGIDNNIACDHERQHTYQGEMLGPLYIPANLIGGVLGLTLDGNWHGPSNFMETGPMSHPPVPWR